MDGRGNGMSCYLSVPGSQVRDLEERLVEKEYELKQMRRNLDESEGAIAQVGGRHFHVLKLRLRGERLHIA